MKKHVERFFKVLVFTTVIAMVLLVGVAAAQGEGPTDPGTTITTPAAIETYLNLGIIFLVTLGLKSFSGILGRDLTGYAAQIAAGIVSAVIFFFNALLSAVPDAQAPIVSAALYLLVTILGAFGTHKLVQAFSSNPQALKASSTTP